MEPPDANTLHTDLVAAFFHPPQVVVCGFEGNSGFDVTIVSHVELWPWRTVVRGSVTRSGTIGYHADVQNLSDRRALGHAWFQEWSQEWSLVDDVGTVYLQVGAGSGGDGFCQDFEVRFGTAVPAEASRLTVAAPGGHRIDVLL